MFLILVDVIEAKDVRMLDQLHDGDLALHLADKNRHTDTATVRAQDVTPCTILAFHHGRSLVWHHSRSLVRAGHDCAMKHPRVNGLMLNPV